MGFTTSILFLMISFILNVNKIFLQNRNILLQFFQVNFYGLNFYIYLKSIEIHEEL